MKKTSNFILTIFAALSIISGVSGQEKKQVKLFGKIATQNVNPENGFIRCASTEYEQHLKEKNPKRMTNSQFEAWIKPLIEKQKSNKQLFSQDGDIISIPVVVHVIHNGDAYGTNENITDEQVISQITVMNQDYRRLAGTPGFNTNTIGADTQIQFVLAKVDQNGNPTNGIDRVNLCKESWSDMDVDDIVKPSTIWDPTQYMNMWSVSFDDPDLLGYAQFPDGSGLGGMEPIGGPANQDGVVAGYGFFGSSAIVSGSFTAPYDKGRTMTHEVGHFLGLRHIWGDNDSCVVDATDSEKDFCPDTPAAAEPNYGCVAGTNTCPDAAGNDMIENYMDYTDDACMNIFTVNQKARMIAVLNNSPRRASLKTSVKDIPIALFANDAEVKIENSCSSSTANCSSPTPTYPLKVISLYNRGTEVLTSATINYDINGGTPNVLNWTGSLAPNSFAYVTLTNTAVSGTLNVSVTTANGVTDQRASNNTATKIFESATPVSNFNQTAFTFTLVGDQYASETTWELKNSAGTVLYSGGPYEDLEEEGIQPLVTNQPWTLSPNDCYTLTFTDDAGDGICCDYGNGFYEVRTNSGATLVVTGGAFEEEDFKYFSTNALGVNSFNLNSIYIYPNPSKNILNISKSEDGILPSSYEIYNTLGQLIDRKNITTASDLSINTSAYSNGVYLITITKAYQKNTLRFIKE